MVSPYLNKKKEGQLSLNIGAKKLFQLIYIKKNNLKKTEEGTSKIAVSAMVSKLAFVYEKIRNAVDYEDDHLLRKNAIKRIFKRQILIEGIIKDVKSQELSIHLLTELIQAGYINANSVSDKKIIEIGDILEKYIKLKDFCFKKENLLFNFSRKTKGNKKRSKKDQKNLSNWIISLAASEVEDSLTKDKVKQEIIIDMFDVLKDNIKLPKDLPHEKDLDIQIYLGIARNYLNFDTDLLSFILFKYYNKDWAKIDDRGIAVLAEKIDVLRLVVSQQLDHPLGKQLDKIIKSYSLYFSILQEVIEENPIKIYDQALNNYKAFINLIKETCERRYKKIKNKLWSSGVRSIIYIFLTKSIFVFLLEIPAIKWFGEEINIFTLAINVSFPAFLLFVMILFTWAPAQENTKKIISGVEEIVYDEKRRKNAIILRKPPKRSFFIDAIFNILYLAGFSVTIYFVIKFLNFVGFNWVNITIFLFFLMFVSFFSFRIKRDIKKFIIVESKDNLFNFLFDFFYTPIIAVGKFLSNSASRVNIFVFILDFIIEAPFKVFVEVFDDWMKYIRERKEDLVN
ncbi:MAG: hypothetical protein PHP37_00330 [Patescibacteria group bacterium]|nr:hypothetical protein [Patescibacteria group bacterium]